MGCSVEVMGYSVYAGALSDIHWHQQGVINTINPHSFVEATKDDDFRAALHGSSLLIPDGIGICYAATLLKGRRFARITGYDLFIHLLQLLDRDKGSCLFFGSSPRTLALIEERLHREFPNVRVGTLSPPYKKVFSDEEDASFVRTINDAAPDVLFVGMTAPKQEKWVAKNRAALNVGTIASIGAVFDFYAGTVQRPPEIFIRNNLEWLVRLFNEPRRLYKRTLYSMPKFIFACFRHKIRQMKG